MKAIKKSYLFYDIETSGLNPCFDQILQFAAIRLDTDFNEIARHEIKIRLRSDVILSPAALITHRIGVQQALTGEDEYTAIRKIHRLINTPGTISVGYNNLGFDDEFLRFNFYRNLLSPYTHQFANECQRIDIYPLTIMYHLHKPEAIQWPNIDGYVSLKLENINLANQFTTGRAHDAMVDVIATLELAKKFAQHKSTWHYLLGNFDKAIESQRQKKLPNSLQIGEQSYTQAVMIKGKMGGGLHYQAPVIKLGQHHHYKNQSIWLRLDTHQLAETTTESLATTTFVIRKKAGEQEFLLPLQAKYNRYLSGERKALLKQNQAWLQQNPELMLAICDYHLNYTYPHIPNIDIDAALYTRGFPSRETEALFQQFHQAPAAEKMQVANLFPDSVHRQLAQRLMARNFPNQLRELEQHQFTQYQQILYSENSIQVPVDFRGQPKLTRDNALQQIAQLVANNQLDNEQNQLLSELRNFLTTRN